MRLYSPVDLTGNVNMIEKLILGGTERHQVTNMEEGLGIDGCESKHWKKEGHEVSGEQEMRSGDLRNHPCSVCSQDVCALCNVKM